MGQNWIEWLSGLIERKQINQKGLAKLVEVSPSAVSHWLDGTKPDGEQIIKLARLSGDIEPDELFAVVWGLEPRVASARPLSPARRRLLALLQGRSEKAVDNVALAIDVFLNGLGE